MSIRALHAKAMYITENQRKTDDNTRALYFSQTVSVWLRIRLDILGALILGSCAAFAVASVGSTISPGSFGLLISYALGITSGLNYSVMLFSMAESMMNSVERVLYYSVPRDEEKWDATNPELEDRVSEGRLATAGAISFQGVEMRYREDLDLVLKGVSFDLKAGERIGVCGRTGSGKSSLLVAFVSNGGALWRDYPHRWGWTYLKSLCTPSDLSWPSSLRTLLSSMGPYGITSTHFSPTLMPRSGKPCSTVSWPMSSDVFPFNCPLQ